MAKQPLQRADLHSAFQALQNPLETTAEQRHAVRAGRKAGRRKSEKKSGASSRRNEELPQGVTDAAEWISSLSPRRGGPAIEITALSLATALDPRKPLVDVNLYPTGRHRTGHP